VNPPAELPQTASPRIRDVAGLLVVACLFAVVGGYLDAYSYLAHDHVFANAQTGNVVLFSVYASGGEWVRALRHLPPIAAFAMGTAIAKLLGVRKQKHSFRATLACQTFELVILVTLASTGQYLPDAWIVPVVSFVAALQNTGFSSVGPWSFNSAMTTGNLRDATSGLVLWLIGRDTTNNRRKAITLACICFSFLVGALFGGACTRVAVRHALVPCIAIVAVATLLTWRERRKIARGSTVGVST
jgi:uncharacterized membrane protein YoaK (UPF0700 family)